MQDEKIQLKTEGGQALEVVVLSKHADRIEVVIGEDFRCTLTPSRNKLAYVGSVRGRELVYERSHAEVKADLAKRDAQHRRIR